MGTLDSGGEQTNSLEEMKNRAATYFMNLYTTEDRTPLIPNLNIDTNTRPTEEQNVKLRVTPSEKEIWIILKSMANGKAPGMDGLTTKIIKHHWKTVKHIVIAAILHFFYTKRMLRSLNLAILTLIPKKNAPERLEDYRPISCLGVMYKIFSKLLASRLSAVLLDLIAQNQTSFIKARRITTAIGLAQEFT